MNDNIDAYKKFLNTQKLIRDVDEVHIIDLDKNILFTTLRDDQQYIPPVDKALNLVLDDDRPLKIINAPENISAAIMRLQNFEDRFLYVVKYLDKDISKYLAESEEAINFYYRVEEKSTGIKISFAIIYIIVVSVLLFVSISIHGVFVVVIMGNPKTIASAIAMPNDSEYEGSIKAEASLKTLYFSLLKTASLNSTFFFNLF